MFSTFLKSNIISIFNLFKIDKQDSIIEPLICLIRLSIL